MAELMPKGTFSRIVGTPGGTALTTFVVGTEIAMNNYTRFLPLEITAYITDSGGVTTKMKLTARDEFIAAWWANAQGAWNVARMARYYFDAGIGIDYGIEPIASGLLCDTAASYHVADIVPIPANCSVTALFFEMRMYA
jgi:hypothetical protein